MLYKVYPHTKMDREGRPSEKTEKKTAGRVGEGEKENALS